MKKILFIFILTCNAAFSANSLKAVHTVDCSKLSNPKKPFILVLNRGQYLISAVTQCFVDGKIKAASLSGLGGIENPTLAYYSIPGKKYEFKTFNEEYELVSLTGNVTTLNDKPLLHVHVGLGNDKYQLIAGHLKDAQVSITAEITVIPLNGTILRKHDDVKDLNLIQ